MYDKINYRNIYKYPMVCCPVEDPCDSFVIPGIPAIVVVVLVGFFSKMVMKFIPGVKDELPSWAKFLFSFVLQLFVGFLIQNLANKRNMWKNPLSAGGVGIFNLLILTIMVLFPALLPTFFSEF